VRTGLAHARQNGKKLGRPITAAIRASEVRALHRAGISKAQIARRLQIGRTSVRRDSGLTYFRETSLATNMSGCQDW